MKMKLIRTVGFILCFPALWVATCSGAEEPALQFW